MHRQFFPSRTLAKCALAIIIALALSLFAAAASTQTAPAAPFDTTALVRRAVQHRLDAQKTHSPVQYVIRKTDERLDSTKLMIETNDGDVARLIAVNGKPLTPDAEKTELARLDNLAQHPELQEHRRKQEQEDTDRIDHILSLLPDALLYHFEGMAPCPSGQCYRLSFKPSPTFTPPDIEASILTGVDGEVWIDQAQERLTRLDAHFIRNVDIGFGILFKLNKDGTVSLRQTNVGNNDWELTGLTMHVTGKILVLKSFSNQSTQEMSHFSPVLPNLSYRDAIQLLKKYDPSTAAYTP
jgi:hypothetical protein